MRAPVSTFRRPSGRAAGPFRSFAAATRATAGLRPTGSVRDRAYRSCSREHVDAFSAQQINGRDQREADARGRIIACDSLEEHDAEAFGAHGARTTAPAPCAPN